MKIFRHKNGFLYSISQIGRNKNITPNKDYNQWQATPYKTNKNAPTLRLGKHLDLHDFDLVFIQ